MLIFEPGKNLLKLADFSAPKDSTKRGVNFSTRNERLTNSDERPQYPSIDQSRARNQTSRSVKISHTNAHDLRFQFLTSLLPGFHSNSATPNLLA